MDATQAISDSILESEEEENEQESQTGRGKPLAKLCILSNPHISERELLLFLGDNILGRDPNTSTLQLLAPSVSKQHATISISVFRRRGRDSEVDMEALVWDLGSMNGTRKGRLKLTPHVRYALSEGDTLILGNIPCRYVSCRVDSPSSQDGTGTPLCRHSEVTGSEKRVSNGTKAMRTPVTGGCLSFEQTPVQPQGTLVPESDSDSEGERGWRGGRKPKMIVSDSESHKSSPRSSAFLSPPNKVVPESEDESLITPSSSGKTVSNRRICFSLEKAEVGREPMPMEKNKSPVFVENGEEGTTKGEMSSEESGNSVKKEIKNPTGVVELLESTSASRGGIPEFNLDSDTDVEGGEEEVMPAEQRDQPPSTVISHMDSDTDVDEDTTDKAPKPFPSTEENPKPHEDASGVQLEGITMDSDTDVDDDEVPVTSKVTLFQGVHTGTPSVQSGDFHLDSDTDVDEDKDDPTETKQKNPKTEESLSEKSHKPTLAAPPNQHSDSDTCDEATDKPSVAAAGTPADGRADLDILSDSDTDVEEDSPHAISATATNLSLSSAAAPAALESDSNTETDVNKPDVPQAGDEDPRMEKDSNVEDEEANQGEVEEARTSHLQRENTPASLVPLLQNCSTPIQFSEREVEQMETQAFTSPGSDAVTSSLGPVVMSSCSDSQEDEDYAVAETQSFILQTKDSHKSFNPNLPSVLKPSTVKPEDQSSRGDSFQLGLSDSSQLQGEFRALAMENTQAYVSVDAGVNLEDTQGYEETPGENDHNLEATQPYGEDEEPSKCSEITKKQGGCVDLAFEATQAYVSEPFDEELDEDKKHHSDGTENVSSACCLAETQPMSPSVEPNNSVCSFVPVTIGVQQETEEYQEKYVIGAQSVAETRPRHTSNNNELLLKSRTPAEEQKHQRTCSALSLAETQPMCMSDSEESNDGGLSAEFPRPAEVESQPITSLALSLAETQPMPVSSDETQSMDLCEDSKNNSQDPEMQLPRKRKAKQVHIDGEDSQQHTNADAQIAATQPMNPSEDDDDSDSMPSLRKRKAKPLQLEDETQSLIGSQVTPVGSQASATLEEEQNSEDFFTTRKRKAKPLQLEDETQSLIGSQASAAGTHLSDINSEATGVVTSYGEETKPKAACKDEQSLAERETQAPLSGVSDFKAQTEGKDGNESMKYPCKKKAKQLHVEEEETQPNVVSDIPLAESQKKSKVSPSTKETREQTKRKEQTKSGSDIEDQKETSLETTKTNQYEKSEKREEKQEHRATLEKTTGTKEKQLKKSLENKDEEKNPEGSVRIRRTARRTTAASREARLEQNQASSVIEDFPARRTRSRSNSSNSVSSERSVNSNTQEGRGRGRGATRSSGVPQTAAKRSSRRRTTVAAGEQESEAQVLSSTSISSDRGRPQGRGRKTISHHDVVTHVTRENEQNYTMRSRKARRSSTEVSQQGDERTADSQLTGTKRGQQRASANGPEALALNDEALQSNQEKESEEPEPPFRRNLKGRGPKAVKTEHVQEAEVPTAHDGEEVRSKRKTRTSDAKPEVDRVQKSTEVQNNKEEKKENPAGVQGKRTNRSSSTQVTNNEESPPKREVEDGRKVVEGATEKGARGRIAGGQKNKKQGSEESQTSGFSIDQDGSKEISEHPQIPAMTPSRKRQASSDASPVAKTPRSSSASPATVSRLRTGSQAYKVLFTGVMDESGERVLARLGGAMANGVSDMNCLVTDKVRRTVKFLCAVAKGVPVVTTQWLEKSGKAGTFLSPHGFVVKDPEQEKKFSFSLQESLKTASAQPLLQGYEIHVTKSVKPEPVHMKDIIACSGAKFLPKMPAAHQPRTVVISCEEDLRLCGPAMSASLPVVSAEFLLTGILQQKVDFQTHAISPPVTNLQPAEGRGRRRKKT